VDEVLVMSVHPGFGGQKYIPIAEEKIATIRKRAEWVNISVDGGIDDQTILGAAAAGANRFVAGSYLFRQDDMRAAIQRLRDLAKAQFCTALK
jgi:ribulose-phosphate 3-epimerase